ncbi:pheromone-regulated protein prm10 [Kickxella alabastrina]|uniref:Pheromone-regulated protein prm10 n=1 Tax=Kickxella alabastrina TaxID=61397 RepID=A0ACC1IJ48_9FUNG|nr:pheromone-regulated protein prm10 [Kickxella alabastrina]
MATLETISEHGPLERDLTKLAAGLQNIRQTPALATTTTRSQRPLQIHLDIAAVEHSIETGTPSSAAPERHGLLSHYLQLADIDKQREQLEKKQNKKYPAQQAAGSEKAIRDTEPDSHETPSRGHRVAQIRNRFIGSKILRYRRNNSSARSRSSIDLSGSAQPRAESDPLACQPHSAPAAVSFEGPQTGGEAIAGFAGAHAYPSTDDNITSSPQRPSTILARATNSNKFVGMDLTQFLPYALSAPGLQSMVGSPLASHAPSINDLTGWFKKRESILDMPAATATTAATPASEFMPTEEDALNDKHSRLLDGIHRLLLHQRFICLLAQSMMQYGAPLHHLEDNLSRMAHRLQIPATFTTMPGLVLISIEDTSTFTSDTKIIRCPNGYDMHRLELTDRVFRKVGKNEMDVDEGTRQLTEIMNAPPLFAWYWQLLVWGISSWSVCLLAFSGSWVDSLAAFILGLGAGCLNLLASRLKGFTNLFEVMVSIMCGFFATVFQRWICFGAVTLSATAVLLPGLLLTTGIIELASRNMNAGTTRVAYALMIAFVIAFGIRLGNDIFVEIFSRPNRVPDMNTAVCSPVSRWWWWLTFPIAISAICMLINVHPRQWHACIIVAGTMFAVFWTLVIHLNLQIIGPVVSAFVLGLAANIWSKIFKHNAYAIMLPGMMILVPGSVGVRGIMSMFSGTTTGASTQLAVQMAQTSLSIMKSGKWACVVCGLKQSLKQVFFESTAPKDCRTAVMEFNMNRGVAQETRNYAMSIELTQLQQQQQQVIARSSSDSTTRSPHTQKPVDTGIGSSVSKWADYIDSDGSDLEDNDDGGNRSNGQDPQRGIDKWNRIVIGRVQQDRDATEKPISKTRKPSILPTSKAAQSVSKPKSISEGSGRYAPYRKALRAITSANSVQVGAPAFIQELSVLSQKNTNANTIQIQSAPTTVNSTVVAAAQPKEPHNARESKWSEFDSGSDSDSDEN